jgi:hypothetical protein
MRISQYKSMSISELYKKSSEIAIEMIRRFPLSFEEKIIDNNEKTIIDSIIEEKRLENKKTW